MHIEQVLRDGTADLSDPKTDSRMFYDRDYRLFVVICPFLGEHSGDYRKEFASFDRAFEWWEEIVSW